MPRSLRQIEAQKRKALGAASAKALKCVERAVERQGKRLAEQTTDLADLRECLVAWRKLDAEYREFLMGSVK